MKRWQWVTITNRRLKTRATEWISTIINVIFFFAPVLFLLWQMCETAHRTASTVLSHAAVTDLLLPSDVTHLSCEDTQRVTRGAESEAGALVNFLSVNEWNTYLMVASASFTNQASNIQPSLFFLPAAGGRRDCSLSAFQGWALLCTSQR